MYDSLSPSEKDLLSMAKAHVAERRRLAEEERNRTLTFAARSQRVADGFHAKLFDQIAKNIGVNTSTVLERQQAERNSAMDFLLGEKRMALERASETTKYHQLQISERVERFRRRLSQPASPNFAGTYLASATDIQLGANVGSTSIAPQENLAHTKVERLGWVSALQGDLRGDVATVDWHFLWTPPQDGVISVITSVSMTGWGFAYPGPGCIRGSSSYLVQAQLRVTQVGAGGLPFSDFIFDNIASDSFNGSDVPTSGGIILQPRNFDDSTSLVYNNQFMAIGQTPLMITVTIFLEVLVSHGEAELNFLDGDFGLNVPLVFVSVS